MAHPSDRQRPNLAGRRGTRVALLGVAAALLAVTSCSGSSSSAGGSVSISSPPAVAPQGSPDAKHANGQLADATETFRQQATRPGGTSSTDVLSVPWTYVGTTAGGRTVAIGFTYGGCTQFDTTVVTASTAAVELQVFVTDPRSRNRACPAIARLARGTVTLTSPLGSRSLLHGPLTTAR